MTRNPRFKTMDFPSNQIYSILPKPITLGTCAIRALYENTLSISSHFDIEQLRAYDQSSLQRKSNVNEPYKTVIGGVLYLDLWELPDSAKIIDEWTLRPGKYMFMSKSLSDKY